MQLQKKAGGIIINNYKVALVHQAKTQTWVLPKGQVEFGESLLRTARREIYEETGIVNPQFIVKLGTYTRKSKLGPDILKEITYFLFKTTQKKVCCFDGEITNIQWIDIADVPRLLSYQEDRDFFLKVKSKVLFWYEHPIII